MCNIAVDWSITFTLIEIIPNCSVSNLRLWKHCKIQVLQTGELREAYLFRRKTDGSQPLY